MKNNKKIYNSSHKRINN